MKQEVFMRLEGGLKLNGAGSRFTAGQPLVTVVTVARNCCEFLEGTIRSVLGQTYKNIEYIVIDGGSTDGSVEILRQYADRIDQWLSEADNGIYEAMNKGAALAAGEWIIFMNAGDRFYDNEVVSRVFSRDCSCYDLMYGDEELDYGGRFAKILKAGSAEDLWKGMQFSHQSVFVRTALVLRTGFNTDNTIGADFEMIYRLKQEGRTFLHLDETVAVTQAGGLSDTKRVGTFISYWQVVSAYGGSLKVSLYYFGKICDSLLRSAVKRLLPQKIIDLVTRLKR